MEVLWRWRTRVGISLRSSRSLSQRSKLLFPVEIVGTIIEGSGIYFFEASSTGISSSSVSHPGNEHQRISGTSMSAWCKGGASGTELCNPKRSVSKVEGSSSGSVADRRREGEEGTGAEESKLKKERCDGWNGEL